MGRAEIVEVTYQPKVTNVSRLVKVLKRHRSFHGLHSNDKRLRKAARAHLKRGELRWARGKLRFIRSKYTLRKRFPDLYYLPLSEQQAMRLNSWSYFGGAFPKLLTPAQKRLRGKLRRALKRRRPKGLRPVRLGKGRRAYARKLKAWLSR